MPQHESSSSGSIPRHLIATALLGMVLTGNATPAHAAENATTEITHDTPVDAITDPIHQAVGIQSEALISGLTVRVTEAASTLPGYDTILSTAHVREASNALQSIPYPITGESTVAIEKAMREVAAVPDEEARTALEETVPEAIIARILSAARFNDIEPAAAQSLLSAVNPDVPLELSETVEVLDASSATNTYWTDHAALAKEVQDLPLDSKARQLVELIIADDAHSAISAKDQLDALNKDAVEVWQEYQDASEGVSTEMHAIASGLDAKFDATIEQFIQTHNSIEPTLLVDTVPPELSDRGALIDLTGIQGSKEYYNFDTTLDGKEKIPGQFGEVYSAEGGVQLRLFEDSNISPDARNQFERLIRDVEPLLNAAFANGDLVAVRLALGESFDPYYLPTLREVHMVLSADGTLSEDQFRSILVHETVHALVSSAFRTEQTVTDQEALWVKNACSVLGAEAYAQYAEGLQLEGESLGNLIESSSGETKRAFELLQDAVVQKQLGEIVEQSLLMYADQKDLDSTACAENTFGDVMVLLMQADGIEDAATKYKAFSQVLFETDDFKALLNVWIESIHKYSLFKKLNESSFVETDSSMKEYLGHSRDNANEMIATVTNVSLSYPEELKQLMSSLDQLEQMAVLRGIGAGYLVIANRHPSLQEYLGRHLQQFLPR